MYIVTCLEMYNKILIISLKTMHFSVTWINLVYMGLELDFAKTCTLPKTRPTLKK